MRDDRRPGFDLTFNAPKSVSLVYARTKDDRIIQAFRQMHLDVIAEMERDAATRVRLNGQKDGYRVTGNLVWGENIHLTARPVGGIPDPHLHSHCYVLNMTFDGVEDRWKALEMRRICDEADYYNRVAVKRLAENLQKLGLEIVFTKDSLEIVGVSKELRDKFSKRTKTIEEYAAAHGVTDPEQKAKIAVLTREKKAKNMLLSEMEPFWWASLTPEEAQALDRIGEKLRRSQAAELSRTLTGGVEPARIAVERSAGLLGQKDGTWAERNAGKRMSLNKRERPIGEALVVDTITARLNRPHVLLNNVTLENGGGTTQIDHILVADTGIFVIETKHYSGWIFGDPYESHWTWVHFQKKFRFQNPIRQNYGHLKAVQSLFTLPEDNFIPLVVFTGNAEFKTDVGPTVVKLVDLVRLLDADRPVLFDEKKMAYIVGRIEMKRLRRSIETDEYHLNFVQRRIQGRVIARV